MVAVMTSSVFYSPLTEPPHSYRKATNSQQMISQVGSFSRPRSLLSGYGGLKSLHHTGRHLVRDKPRRNGKWRPSRVMHCEASLNVVFVGSEAAPWSKTGGLADVLAGLPPALAERGHRVMTVVPRYDQYHDAWDTSVVVEVKVGEELHNVRFFHSYQEGVDRVFVDHPLFLEKVWGETGSRIYGPVAGKDYVDNNKRFSLLCKAALEAPRVLNLNCQENFSGPYGEDVLFVCNDWHTGLLPCYLKNIYQVNGIYKNAKSLLCIHNISYQGRFRFEEYSSLGLADEFKPSFAYIDGYCDPAQGLEMNWLKAGVLEVDKVLTVSPYYAQELVSHHFKGMGLEPVLQQRGVTGILNGTDVQDWNPATDKYIPFKYDISTVLDAKPLVKEALQAEVGLPVDRSIPLIGFMGRIEEQKGGDILAASLPEFIEENVQLVALGMGKKKFERQLQQLEEAYSNKMSWVAKYCVRTAHMIIAGADYILVPSRFEPCGLIQMHAMRYGTVPIVSSTGGLVDTVKEGYTGFHMGAFNVDGALVDPEDVSAITSTVKRATGVYGTPAFSEMVKNCMSQDLSWKEPAKRWEQVLTSMATATGAETIGYEREVAPLAREVVTTI